MGRRSSFDVCDEPKDGGSGSCAGNAEGPTRNTFLRLLDTPDAYTGQAGKVAVVNEDEEALEFRPFTNGLLTVGPERVTDYTIVMSDADVTPTGAAGLITVTVPTDLDGNYPEAGVQKTILRTGAGEVQVVAADGVVLTWPDGALARARDRWSTMTLIKRGSNHWFLAGDVEPVEEGVSPTFLATTLAGYSPTGHTHTIAQVNGLQDALNGKVSTGLVTGSGLTMQSGRILMRTTAGTGAVEERTAADVTAFLNIFTNTLKGLVPASAGGTDNFLRADGSWAPPPTGGTPGAHNHDIADITGLSDALAGKAATDHDHTIPDVTGLQDAIDSKGPIRGQVKTVSTTTFVPGLNDENCWIRLTSGTGCVVTLPNDATVAFPIGAEIIFQLTTVSEMSFQPSGGAPALEFPSTHQAAANVRFSIVHAKKTAANTWAIVGNLRVA